MLSVMYFPFAGCVWNTVPNREVLPLQVTRDRCMNKKRSISRTLDAWHRYRKTMWIFSFLQNMCNLSLRLSFNPKLWWWDCRKKTVYHWRPLRAANLWESTGTAERWTKTGWNKKNSGTNHQYKTISQMNVNFLELSSPICTSPLCCGGLWDRIQLN